jgi:hypothetical protein
MLPIILPEGDEQGGGAGSIVRADEPDVLERIVGLIV